MLATFVIGLREGLEAALIVGIIAAFLKQRGTPRDLRFVWLGVLAALTICLAVGITLQVISADLPQRQQEGLETVIGAVAVGMVTYMVVWMRRHSRDLKGQLENAAGSALARGSARALVLMAFLAVLREGLETAVFLIAAFNASGNGLNAGFGALLGVLLAAGLGWGIYRGGVKINMSRFFRATGVVLVVVAAGLVMTAFHTAHEAGWINVGQERVVDLSWLVRNGSVQASLITGVLGIQSGPTVIEVVGWLAYLVPFVLFVAWPPNRQAPWKAVAWVATGLAAAAAAAAVAFAVAAPTAPGRTQQARWTTAVTGTSSSKVSAAGFTSMAIRTPVTGSTSWTAGAAKVTGSDEKSAIPVSVLNRTSSQPVPASAGLPTNATPQQLVALNGGRLPIGISSRDAAASYPISYQERVSETLWRDPTTGLLLDASRRAVIVATAKTTSGPIVLGAVRETITKPTSAAVAAAVTLDRDQRATAGQASRWGSTYPRTFGIAAALLSIVAGTAGFAAHLPVDGSPSRAPAEGSPTPVAAGSRSTQNLG